MKKSLMPYVARAISSNGLRDTRRALMELRRRALGEPHRIRVFLRVDDPYSALLVQALPGFLARFDVQAEFYTVLDLDDEMFPAPEMWEANALHDAAHLARLYDMPYAPDMESLRDRSQVEKATALLISAERNDHNYLTLARQLFTALWQGDGVVHEGGDASLDDPQVREHLAANERFLAREGHYLSAMIHYAGEWYWGIDRLDHLERRLIDLGAARNPGEQVQFDRTWRDFCTRRRPEGADDRTPLVLYWSARSPYSYIGLERAVQLSHFHGIPLDIKPVLPMMMRGMNVPRAKKLYIFLDTKREAAKLGLPYGFVADPLGAAVERCYALLDYAHSAGKLEDFLLSFARGVNAEGIRAETDTGMRRLVERCGLEWEKARHLLGQDSWRDQVKRNQEEMFSLGCWGVPSFQYGDLVFWGQDRLGLIEKAILEQTPGQAAPAETAHRERPPA